MQYSHAKKKDAYLLTFAGQTGALQAATSVRKNHSCHSLLLFVAVINGANLDARIVLTFSEKNLPCWDGIMPLRLLRFKTNVKNAAYPTHSLFTLYPSGIVIGGLVWRKVLWMVSARTHFVYSTGRFLASATGPFGFRRQRVACCSPPMLH